MVQFSYQFQLDTKSKGSLTDLYACASLRGTGGDLVILEEAAFIATEVWMEVVIPLLEVRDTGLIAISTPLDQSNFYSTLVQMTDPASGQKVFEVLEARAACAQCIETLEDPSKCPHMMLERPAWKSKQKQNVVKALYSGNKGMLLRESLGVVTDTAEGIFMKKTVRAMFDKPRVDTPLDVKHVYVAIDPTGGGPSKFAIVSGTRQSGAITVIGIDEGRISTHEEMRRLVLRHVSGLNRLFVHQRTVPTILVMVESNLGMEASHIQHALAQVSNVVCLRETGPEGKWGVSLTHERKLSYVAVTEQLLMEHAISIGAKVVSDDPEECLTTLKQQLQNYRKVNSELGRSTVFAQAKHTYSGKVTEDGRMLPQAMQDDLCITFQMLCWWSAYIIQRKCKFLNYAKIYDSIE